MTTIALLCLAVVLAQAGARVFDQCHKLDSNPYLLMGTKTAYQFVWGKERMKPVPECVPAQMWILARHGARYPGEKTIMQLLALPKLRDQIIYNHEIRGNGRLCDADLQELRQWAPHPNLTMSMANFLTPQGRQDIALLAKRLQSEFPEVLRPDSQSLNSQKYKFRATKPQRTQASMDAFMEGLFGSNTAVQPEETPANDSLLYAYKNCPSWQDSLSRDHVNAESEMFIAGQEYQNLLENVSSRLGFLHNIKNDSIHVMYDMCRYEKSWRISKTSAWCAVFTTNELKILEYLDDLDHYYYCGPGREINAKLGCPLIQDMFNHFRNLERGNFDNEPKGIFYFTHTVTLQNLLAALGLANDSTPLLASNYYFMQRRSYRTSYISPFASNLVAVFYRCSDVRSPNKVMFYLNEMPVYMEGCRVGLCDWDYLKERFGRVADECSLDFCNSNSASEHFNHGAVLLLVTAIAILRTYL